MVVLCLAVPVSVAGAAAPYGAYPPTTTTTIFIPPTSFSQTSTVNIGSQFTVEACGFLPNTLASYTFNGIPEGTFVADGNGCITIVIKTSDPHVTINGGPLLPANYTGNAIVASGTGANTAGRTYTLIFNIVQPGAATGNGSVTDAAASSSSASTGTASASGSTSASGTASRSSGTDSPNGSTTHAGLLAFTGTNAVLTAGIGLVLLAIGGLLVLLARRRSSARRSS
jgi:hypothetical protein